MEEIKALEFYASSFPFDFYGVTKGEPPYLLW